MNLDDLAKLIPNAAWRLPEDDGDPQETREWLEALDALIAAEGPERATFLLKQLLQHARTRRVPLPQVLNTPYLNTISLAEQAPFPGNLEIEQRLSALVRWNALAMVVRANQASAELGGHIASYASAAELFEVGFNHFFRAGSESPESRGDLVYFQPHSAPGVYARAFLEGRLSAEQLDHYRRETAGGGLSSYPHPWLMPDFWQFPTGSMGLGPLFAIYQARFLRYLEHRGIARTYSRKVWAFVGDGEMDEPESLAGLSIAAREGLDNLVFVVNCNLQRLDGPVRGNGSIIQELEGLYAGAGWNVIKLLWGSDWDPLFARDTQMLLLRAFHETVDGEFQTLSATDGRFNREHFFNKYPELAQLTAHLSDDDIDRLRRGGHDPVKIHAAYHAAVRHRGQPTVILAKTKKGYGMGSAGQGRMTTHQQKKLDAEALREFRDRFALPLTDAQVEHVEYSRPADDSPEMKYLHARRAKLGGYLPARSSVCEPLAVPAIETFARFALDASGKEMSTTMAVVRMLGALLKDAGLGSRIVPIIADEARTFGMADLFRQVGIYSPFGQLYEPEDSAQISYYKEAKNGQILEEGINEAGAIASWVAAGTSYSTNGVAMLPFYIFYSMFGFQRVGDLLWAAADSRTRGFLLGATAGRTTLSGEGLQHEDGTSHLIASTVPNCRAYDPCFAYELAVIVEHGMRRMLAEQRDEFYYITVMNENYAQPSLPAAAEIATGAPMRRPSPGLSPAEGNKLEADIVREGILRGLHRVRATTLGSARVRLLGAGTILREALVAAELLENDFGIGADVYSVTSFTELRRDALALRRAARLGEPTAPCWIEQQLPATGAPVVAASDYVSAVADLIRPWVRDSYVALGTDGFGRSDTRAALRAFFEVDRRSIALTALQSLDPAAAAKARSRWGIEATPPPWTR
ncbi:MAG TPA: pyruvate dehydrogenase (acetyl-transferring), homodimeric type [Burkholderiaceae bacterium]|nr:pyruvate dehydrogenase (acetyl-transferring), homodimeric type [Burkholderiaceae bacterium]HQR69279.1 pyruvate dehydrogenase (acetyl-transferring), homodimeric type [Burkholderiaceae bacterium]